MSRSADEKTGAAREDAGEVRAAPSSLSTAAADSLSGHVCDWTLV